MTGPEFSGEEKRLAALTSRLPEGRSGLLRWPEAVDSTNTRMKEWARQGAPDRSVLLAETQSAGRGRLGRSFVSPPGGLYLSYLLYPRLAPENVGEITAWVAVAVRRALKRCCGLSPDIKWVNDLQWQGRKLCGILCETVLRRDRVESLVLGVGINVSTAEEDLPPQLRKTAASLRSLGFPVPGRSALAAELILALDELAADFPRGREDRLAEYRSACVTLGQDVILSDGTAAHAEGLDADFSLLLRLPDGSLRKLRSGEATLHKD